MTTILIVKGDRDLKQLEATIQDGTIWSVSGLPLINNALLNLPGGITRAAAIAASKAGDYDKLAGTIMVAGDNAGGKTALVGDAAISAWRDAQAAKHEAAAQTEAERLNQLIPGINALRTARRGEYIDHEAMSRAIDSGDCGIPAKKYTGESAESLEERYPDAARYLLADMYADASHFEKASAGSAAMKAMEAGENPKKAIAKMESDWSDAAARCVANS